jgi:hypothetical protein
MPSPSLPESRGLVHNPSNTHPLWASPLSGECEFSGRAGDARIAASPRAAAVLGARLHAAARFVASKSHLANGLHGESP